MHSYPKISQFLMISIFIFKTCLLLPHRGLSTETTDTITSTSPLRDPNTIISRNEAFKLGFYTPENSTNRYMTIFFAVAENTVVWIANRDKPLKDSSGVIAISEEGNLVLCNGQNEVVWSTNITTRSNPKTAQILDNGNLVLYDHSTGEVIWESFNHPSHILMSTMALVDDTRTGNKVAVSSWKNESDPGTGGFRLGLQALSIPQVFIWHSDGRPHYRSGQWNGQIFIGSRHMYRALYHTRATVTDKISLGIFNFKQTLNEYMILVLDSSGTKSLATWNDHNKTWFSYAFSPQNECDVYGKCGAFGICDVRNSPKICSCMRGFEPVDRQEWERGNWTSGCVRKMQLPCKNNNKGKEDRFFNFTNMKVPDYAERFASSNEEECRIRCLNNCSCIAYAHDSYDIGCMFWKEGDEALIDTQQFPEFGVDFHIRLAASELDDNRDRKTVFIVVPVIGITFCILVLIFWIFKKKGGKTKSDQGVTPSVPLPSDSTAILLRNESKRYVNIEELPSFAFDTLAIATDQFAGNNFLGKGGFGLVYKGKLANGKDIAVKRLSEASSQGIEEFLNEVSMISKLQHRNLVRLMGCCVDKGEKMLIYEYMTNRSLDICLFDHSHPSRNVLDWDKRLNIIKGIGRGLLYLHRDSRLRIIHRDLKASNVLLDREWHPKISDFGMARIIAANQDQANTMRVVGTYGYMAPEYATEGVFSEKSDVYSYGVLMLEIISGKKSSQHYDHGLSMSFLGSAWKFLNEGSGVAFVDRDMLLNSNSGDEIVRCIHVAMLCVQEFAGDRPNIKTVLSMLNGEIVDLPMPEKPVLADNWNSTVAQSTIRKNECSINQLTVTELHGR